MSRICVTGASGKAGRAVTRDLLDHGHEVTAVDLAAGPADLGAPLRRVDLTDYGQAIEALDEAEAVVHLANIPAPGLRPPAVTFNQNTAMNFNVFQAAVKLGLRRVVWASSETTLGLPFDIPPRYAPIDEEHFPFPTTTYALSKVVGETLAEQFAAWSGIPFVGLRISNIHAPEDYRNVPDYWSDPHRRKWNLWGYVDVQDVAQACRLALEAPVQGSQNVIIAAADTLMTRPSAELLGEVFPGVPLRRDVGELGTLLSIERARQILGYEPRHSWREYVAAPTA
jgi:nucleoside-diphosphate-sugar epimerase